MRLDVNAVHRHQVDDVLVSLAFATWVSHVAEASSKLTSMSSVMPVSHRARHAINELADMNGHKPGRVHAGQKEARLCGLLLLICYALRSGSVFLASEWRP